MRGFSLRSVAGQIRGSSGPPSFPVCCACAGDARGVRGGRPAVCKRRVVFEERRATPDHSILDQLGRHSSDDPPTPSRSRRPHGPVTLARSWRIPLGGSRGV